MSVDYNENIYGEHFEKWKTEDKKRRKKTRMFLIILLAVLLALTLVIIFAVSKKSSTLIGTFVYDEYTEYVFEKDGSGRLTVDDLSYEYAYKISGDKLTLDFTENVVRDCEYTFSVKGNELTLIGGKNTDGGTYTLKKK